MLSSPAFFSPVFSGPAFPVVQFGRAFSDIIGAAFSGPVISGPASSAPSYFVHYCYDIPCKYAAIL